VRRFLFLVPLLGAAVLTSVLVHALSSPGSTLLTNGDFEDGSTGWNALPGVLSIVDKGTDHAASITVTSGVVSLSQAIASDPENAYRFTGDFVHLDGDIWWVQPSLLFYDESGELLKAGGIKQAQIPSPASWLLETFDLSCQAASVRISVGVYSVSGGTAIIDDLGLKAVPRDVPCITDTPTPSDTPQPTKTSTAPPTAKNLPPCTPSWAMFWT